MKGVEAIWGKKSSLKGMRGNHYQSNMKKKMAFRAPNVRFSIRRAYKNCKKKDPLICFSIKPANLEEPFFFGLRPKGLIQRNGGETSAPCPLIYIL